MKKYYIDRLTQIKYFKDLSFLDSYKDTDKVSLKILAAECFVVQLAVVPNEENQIKDISFSGNNEIYCLNSQITDKFGKQYKKSISLKKNSIQPLFFIIHANEEKTFKHEDIEIRFITDCGEEKFTLFIDYTDEFVENSGYNDLNRLSRLNWLNSFRFLDDEVTPPYTVPVIENNTVKILGRDIEFGENGLPQQSSYYFDEGINLTNSKQKELFFSDMDFKIESQNIKYEKVKFS